MSAKVATIIIEPRLLVREALESIMTHHSYHVICRAGSTMDIGNPSIITEEPKLVILGAQSTNNAVAEALNIRKLWPDSKILSLFESACFVDFQKLVTSEIDGCVPLSISPDTLIRTLDLLVTRGVRVMITSSKKHLSTQPVRGAELPEPEAKMDNLHAFGTGPIAIAAPMVALQHTQPAMNGTTIVVPSPNKNDAQHAAAPGNLPKLSDREAQILDGLVKGHSNKVIARVYDITEATVKVHMKSILRKIRVDNRTQAAIWALEHGYPAGEIRAEG
jgi:two-component system nitrate/nitrite response regulator NarL